MNEEERGHQRWSIIDDKALITKAMAGNDDAFTELFQRHYSFLFKYLLKLTLNEEISRDLAQETMIKCYMNLSSFKGEGKFSTWMISIASRLYMDSMRKKQREGKKISKIMQQLSRQLSWKSHYHGLEWSDSFTDFNQLEADVRIPILLAPLLRLYIRRNRHYAGHQNRNSEITGSHRNQQAEKGVERR